MCGTAAYQEAAREPRAAAEGLCTETYGGTRNEIKAWAREYGCDISGAKANTAKPLGNAFAEAHDCTVPDSRKATAAKPLK